MTTEQAKAIARSWITAWNSHDMEAILSHYTGDLEMNTPYILSIMNDPSGTLHGNIAGGGPAFPHSCDPLS